MRVEVEEVGMVEKHLVVSLVVMPPSYPEGPPVVWWVLKVGLL